MEKEQSPFRHKPIIIHQEEIFVGYPAKENNFSLQQDSNWGQNNQLYWVANHGAKVSRVH